MGAAAEGAAALRLADAGGVSPGAAALRVAGAGAVAPAAADLRGGAGAGAGPAALRVATAGGVAPGAALERAVAVGAATAGVATGARGASAAAAAAATGTTAAAVTGIAAASAPHSNQQRIVAASAPHSSPHPSLLIAKTKVPASAFVVAFNMSRRRPSAGRLAEECLAGGGRSRARGGNCEFNPSWGRWLSAAPDRCEDSGVTHLHSSRTRRAVLHNATALGLLAVTGLLRPPVARANALRVGQPAPPATLVTLDGKRLSTRDFLGRVVVLTFLATWCEPCRDELPLLSEYQQAHAEDGLTVLGFSLDESDRLDEVRAMVAPLHFPVGLLSASQAPGYGRIWHIPVSFTIDRAGRLADDGWKDKRPVWTAERLQRVVAPLLAQAV